MTYQPLHHKYRPQTFSDLVGQDAIATTLTSALRQQRIAPAYLFTGARGTGKTSSARILAKSLNCLSSQVPTEAPCGACDVCREIASGAALDVIEIDAASNTGVDNIRELIERSQFAPVQGRYKVYIIDEVHMLSTAAFNALLKTLEEPPPHVVFVLATTDPQRVLPTIISRCQRFDFRRIPLDPMVQHLRTIATREAIAITPDALTLVAQIAQGGLRDAESLLDQLSLLTGEITVEQVWDLVGSVPEQDLLGLLSAIAADNPETLLDSVRRLLNRGREPLIVLQNLASFYRDLLIAKTAPDRNDLVALTPPTWTALCEFAQTLELSTILAGQQYLRHSEDQIKSSTQPRLWLEVTLMGLLPSAIASQPAAELNGRSSIANPPPALSAASRASVVPPATKTTAPPTTTPAPPPATESVTAAATPPPISDQPSAEPAPVSPAPPVEAVMTTAAIGDDYTQTWQQILANVDLNGTRAMLSVNCYLLALDAQSVTVGITSQSMLKMITGMLPQLEKACTKTFKAKIKVGLQVVELPPGTTPPNPSSASSAPPSLELADRSAPYSTANGTSPGTPTAHDRPSSPTGTSESGGPIASATLPTVSEPWQENEVAYAAKQLAEFFNGRVVDMSTSGTLPELSELEPIVPVSAADQSAVVWQDSDPESETDDDDVPF